jgi:hypothetical protein
LGSGWDTLDSSKEARRVSQRPFLPSTNIQFAWDSVSLTAALTCAQKYKLEIIEGWSPKGPDAAVALNFGILLHAGVEQFHRLRMEGAEHNDAVIGSLKHLLTIKTRKGFNAVEHLPTPSQVELMMLEDELDEDGDPMKMNNSRIRTRYHLFRALVWYFEHYRDDPLKVIKLRNGQPAVEFSFRVPTGEYLTSGEEILVSGHLDKAVEFNGEPYFTDLKTTKAFTYTWKDMFDISHQMSGYTYGGKVGMALPVRGGWVDGIQLQVGGVKFQRIPTTRSESQLQEYIKMVGYVARLAESWYNEDHYPLNPTSCFLCHFKSVCKQPKEFRHGYLKTYFEQREAWNPLQSR